MSFAGQAGVVKNPLFSLGAYYYFIFTQYGALEDVEGLAKQLKPKHSRTKNTPCMLKFYLPVASQHL